MSRGPNVPGTLLPVLRAFWGSFRLYVPALVVLSLLSVVAACCGCQPRTPPIIPSDVPPGACQAAQERLEELGCHESKTPGGKPFGAECEAAAADGRNWLPQCIAGITRCDQVEDAAAGKVGCP